MGRSLQKNFGTNDPKDVGRAIEQNTPSECPWMTATTLHVLTHKASRNAHAYQCMHDPGVPTCSVPCMDYMLWHVDVDVDTGMCRIAPVRRLL